jgi:hypothetical protein
LVSSISQNPHCLNAAILLHFQSLQNGVLRAFLESASIQTLAIFCACMVPLVLLMKRPPKGTTAAVH